jgi:chloramphenicol O-acetyltransferase
LKYYSRVEKVCETFAFNLNITKFKNHVQDLDLKFYPSFIHLLSTVINEIPGFKRRKENENSYGE